MPPPPDAALVRKAVMVPPALWHQAKIEAATRNLTVSAIITEMLQERYAAQERTTT